MSSDQSPDERDSSADEAPDVGENADDATSTDRPDDRPTTDAVPTITGLFDAPNVEPDDEPEVTTPSDPPPPDTDSIRIIAEMFSGFRRRSGTAEKDLEEMLGTATQAVPTIVAAPKLKDPAPAEPPTTAGAIPVVSPSATFDDVIAPPEDPETDGAQDPEADGAPAPAEVAPHAHDDRPADEEKSVSPNTDEQATITTAYVPRDDENRTEQALAWLTAENVATGQTPIIAASGVLVPRRRHRWVAAIIAPIVVAIVIAVAYVVAFAVWPLDNVSPSTAQTEVDTPVGPAIELPWPEEGQGAVLVEGTDDVLTSADDGSELAPGPMASLTKVITVMTLLEHQPLELGEDGPSYEFGYLDQNQADALRWQNESALDVPVGGTLSYRQLLEGVLMGSAGNYANKLVDDVWDADRDAFITDAITWLQSNGIDDTLIVDATGINPDNQSTADNLVRVAQLAMQNPVVEEIVAQESVDLPGAGTVENSNPLLGESGIVGIKTGHLDEWNVVSYNLMTAKDVDTGSETPTRVYSVIMGQADDDLQASTSRELLDGVEDALQPVDAMAEGTVVAEVTTPWGAEAELVADDTAALALWNGEAADISIDYDIEVGDSDGDEVGVVRISGALDEVEIPIVLSGDVPRPDLEWRLTHPLELLGLGAE